MSYQSSQANKNWGGASGQTYNYYSGASTLNPNSIGNWNTGGAYAGKGNAAGVYNDSGTRIGGSTTDSRIGGGMGIINPVAQQMYGRDLAQAMAYKGGPYPSLQGGLPRGAPTRRGGLLGDEFVDVGPIPGVRSVPTAFRPSVGVAPQGVPGSSGYYDMREALGYNPFAGEYPSNPGGQFGPRTYNDGYQTMRSDKFQNNPAYGSPGGGLAQYNRQTTMNMNGGAGGMMFNYGGPR